MKKIFENIKRLYVILLLLLIPGCGLVMIGVENVNNTIFNSPEPGNLKVKEPIRPDVRLSALWIGHSSVLLQIHDKVILLDPVFNDVISGVMLRREQASINLKTIPKIDMILESHAHMDHLSISTLSDLEELYPSAKLVFPEGVEEFLPDYDFEFIRLKTGNSSKKNYVGESRMIDSVKVTAVYALHFGGRFGLDSYSWHMPGCTGYIVEYKGVTVFYAGDTLYEENAYKELGKKFNIDLAVIPIGPCRDCEEIFNFNHVASYGSLLMLDDLNAKFMLPVHYGAIQYRNDPDYPVHVLQDLMKKRDDQTPHSSGQVFYKDRIVILDEGEQHVFYSIDSTKK